MNIRAAIAELVGVFTLCLVGILAIAHFGPVPGGLLGIAFAHGLAITVMASATGAVSGGHLNPAVTLSMLVTGRIKAADAGGYILGQLIGGALGALLAGQVMTPQIIAGGTPTLGEGFGPVQAIIAEALAAMLLVFVIFGTAVDKRAPKMGALFIGLTIVMCILAFGPISGAAINPARHLGPALLSGNPELVAQTWIYWVGPVLGAVLGALIYDRIVTTRSGEPEEQ